MPHVPLGRGEIELTFLGTRGEIDIRTRRHRRHSALMIRRGAARVMLDCGADWLGKIERIAPTAVVLTHAHPDHAWGLAKGAPCPVYASEETFGLLVHYPLRDKRVLPPRRPIKIGGVTFEAFPVAHSTRAPAVGYRVGEGDLSFFYVPDVVAILDRHAALDGIDLFVGDGATISRTMVRRRGDVLIGHTPVGTQIGWCEKEGVRRAIFTHCGSEIVGADARGMSRLVHDLGREHGVDVRIAYDGLKFALRPCSGVRPR